MTAALVVVIIAAVALIVYLNMKDVTMVVIAGLIFTISLSTFFFPTTYVVDEEKVRIKYLFSAKERNLSAFRAIYPERRGILLSPYLSPSRLENFRGFYLRYGKNNKAEVDEFITNLLKRQRQDLAARQNEGKPDAI